MLIFFTKDHYGKDTSELPSSLLVWIIEHKEDWLLVNECKKVLSDRLKLDWQPSSNDEINKLKAENNQLSNKVDMMAKFLHIFGVEYIDTDKYYRYPQLLQEDWEARVNEGRIILPYNFSKQEFYKEYMKKLRDTDLYKSFLKEVA